MVKMNPKSSYIKMGYTEFGICKYLLKYLLKVEMVLEVYEKETEM